ncbi:MAG: thymidine phosphorylase, partial [Blautia sp.]|nr:thymidine phosphorylase [Blautia sp.]
GHYIEILEALDVLEGRGPEDLIAVCTALASNMLYLAGLGTPAECSFLVKKAISSGAAKNKFREMVAGQGGDVRYLDDPSLFQQDTPYQEVTASADGYIIKMNAEGCGIASSLLGAGRITKESVIDPDAGILLKKKTGDAVQKGDVIATLYSSDPKLFENAKNRFLDSITIGAKKPQERPLILARIEKGQIQYF